MAKKKIKEEAPVVADTLKEKLDEVSTEIKNETEIKPELDNSDKKINDIINKVNELKDNVEKIDLQNTPIEDAEKELDKAIKDGEKLKEELTNEVQKVNNRNFTHFWNGINYGY